MEIIEICKEVNCTGCCACMNICPVGAILMISDKMGKTIPKIDYTKCIQCKLCVQRCPVNNKSQFSKIKKCYAVSTLEPEDILTCSSGGVATGFGRAVIEKEGCVFGTMFDNNMNVVFRCASNLNQLEGFKGSKYVQSYIGYTYKEIKEKINENRLVLFIGTPCQVDGLYNYLKDNPKNLITVDLICHGTPPYKYLREYIGDEDIDEVTFRYKGSWDLIKWKNGVIKSKKKSNTDYYYQAFLTGISYRDNCYNCRYAQSQRISDITIGDFWGLNRDLLLSDFPERVSVVLVNSEKGEMFFEKTKHQFQYLEREIKEAIEGNDNLRKPTSRHEDRFIFEKNYEEKGFLKAVKQTSIKNQVIKSTARNFILLPLKFIRDIILVIKK